MQYSIVQVSRFKPLHLDLLWREGEHQRPLYYLLGTAAANDIMTVKYAGQTYQAINGRWYLATDMTAVTHVRPKEFETGVLILMVHETRHDAIWLEFKPEWPPFGDKLTVGKFNQDGTLYHAIIRKES